MKSTAVAAAAVAALPPTSTATVCRGNGCFGPTRIQRIAPAHYGPSCTEPSRKSSFCEQQQQNSQRQSAFTQKGIPDYRTRITRSSCGLLKNCWEVCDRVRKNNRRESLRVIPEIRVIGGLQLQLKRGAFCFSGAISGIPHLAEASVPAAVDNLPPQGFSPGETRQTIRRMTRMTAAAQAWLPAAGPGSTRWPGPAGR